MIAIQKTILICGERDARTFLRVNILFAEVINYVDRIAPRMPLHPMPYALTADASAHLRE
jgi:hypothetical protein